MRKSAQMVMKHTGGRNHVQDRQRGENQEQTHRQDPRAAGAFWLYLLVDEAEKRGLDPEEFASAAITRCGISQGTDLQKKSGTKSLKGLRKTLFTRAARWVFEMDLVENTDDTLYLDFHYCPLVKAWQKAGCSDKEIARLCDIAMCGDHGIGSCFDARLELPKAIAKGDDICALRYIKSDK